MGRDLLQWGSLVLSRTQFWMVWKCHENSVFMVFHIFIFLFRTTVKKKHSNESDLPHSYGNNFETAILKVTWYQLYSNFFINNYEVHWQWHLKDILKLKILGTWINICANFFLDIKYHETRMSKSAWEVITWTKSELDLRRTLHQDNPLVITFFFFSRTNLVLKFNLVLMR